MKSKNRKNSLAMQKGPKQKTQQRLGTKQNQKTG
jgi:hypothetical protein